MRKEIISGIGILIILLALAGTGSAFPSYGSSMGYGSCSGCHGSGFDGNFFNNTHKFNGASAPIVNAPADSCAHCHIKPPSGGMTNWDMNLTSNGSSYNSTHRYNATTLASVKLAAPACGSCHNDTAGGNFSLVSGAGTSLTSDTCVYCHTELVDDWNLSKHSSPSNISKPVVTCVICHNEHNANNVVTVNTSCLDSACHGSSSNSATKHSYNLTQCKYCHLPKVLTVNTTFDTRSHTFNYSTQLKSSPGDERHAAVFDTLKNVTKNDKVTKTSCENCHGTSKIPSVNFRSAYRASAHNNTANAAAPYCTDCHKTALTTEAKQINGTNTCKDGCHTNINVTHASNKGGADCMNCHFNNSNPLKTHNLYFANDGEYKYTCSVCHTANSNKSIVPQIDEWNDTVHNDKEVGLDGIYNHFYGKFNKTTGVASSQANSCLKCHSPIDWNPAIAESVTTKVPLTANFKGIICNVCHNIHDMDDWFNTTGKVYAWYNRDAIKVSETEYQANYTNMTDTIELCGNCHSNIRYGSTGPGWASATSTTPIKPHGFPAKDLFMGSPKQSGQGFECIDCHMYKNTTYGIGTMADSGKVTGHSFKVNEYALQNTACGSTCHDGTNFKTIPERIEEIQTATHNKWNATNSSVMGALDIYAKYPGVKGSSADKISRAYWNIKLVSSDESWGVHNPDAINTLLDDAATLANASNDSLGMGLTSNVDLKAGWNNVALKGTPSKNDTVTVMSSVSSNITIVWGYNTSKPTKWEFYDPTISNSLNSLKTIVPGQGYWIYATKDCTWTV